MTRRHSSAILVAVTAMATLAMLWQASGSAARASCSGETDASAPTTAQEQTMLCLVNQVRKQRGLKQMSSSRSLVRAAARKSTDILRCDEFSHEACGRDFTHWIDRFGYKGCRKGENIAYGSGSFATPRSIFTMWMRSAGHRRNILGPFEDTGIGLQVGELEGSDGTHVWTQSFGSRNC